METITATVVRMGPDWGDGKGVVNLMGDGGISITAIGPVYGFTPGQALELQGFWKGKDGIGFGRQFQVQEATVGRPQIGPGLIEWLAQAPGIGKITAKHIVEHFEGMDAETLLKTIEDPARLEEIEGLGPTKAKSVSAGAKRRGERDQLTMDLRDKGVPLAAVARVLRKFGDNAPEVVQRYPYSLLGVKGIGFKTCDEIALASGFVSHGSFQRIQAGIIETLDQAARRGHVYLPVKTLLVSKGRGLTGATRLLTLKETTISDKLSRIEESGRIHIADGSVYLEKNYRQEQVIAIRLSDLSAAKVDPIETGLKPGRLLEITPKNGKAFTLSHDQNYAVSMSCFEPVMVITGGPGTGKSAITQAIVKLYQSTGLNIELCAPTGRAAQRLSEATGHGAKTIHRLLEYGPQGFARSRDFPLNCQALIVDEASMLDTALAARLFDALPVGCRVVIVGDQDQLPSIGCGTVLRDIIRSTKVPVVRLNEIFRQSAGSRIATNAQRFIREEPLKYPEHGDPSDFWFHRKNSPGDIIQALGDFLTKHIPAKFGLDPLRDVMVLTPVNGGPLGTVKLNLRLQNLLNPDGQAFSARTGSLRVGDRCMQIKNNYALEVFNGDVGSVLSWDTRKKEAWIKLGPRNVLYTKEHIGGLVPAYACTTHKAQGSEFPAVIGIMDQSHQWMLRANLVYTMMTRASHLLVLIGQRGTLERASRNRQDMDRYTGLAQKLLHPPADLPELNRAEMISNRLYVCDACQRAFNSDSPQIFECPECGESDQIRELGDE